MSTSDEAVYHFRSQPGPRERQLKRRHRNPLFADQAELTQKQVNEARSQDMEAIDRFREELKVLAQEAVDLPSSAESDVILELKERTDQLYERGCGLGGDLSHELEAIKRLTQVIMKSVWHGAGNDAMARSELEGEEQARAKHYELLQYPLVCDLLDPDMPIPMEDLVASLLSEPVEAVKAAMDLFEPEQALELFARADALLEEKREAGAGVERFQGPLKAMAEVIQPALDAGNGTGPLKH